MADVSAFKADVEKALELVNKIASDATLFPVPGVQSVAKIIAVASGELETLLADL